MKKFFHGPFDTKGEGQAFVDGIEHANSYFEGHEIPGSSVTRGPHEVPGKSGWWVETGTNAECEWLDDEEDDDGPEEEV